MNRIYKTLLQSIYNKPQSLNRIICKKYVSQFINNYMSSINRKKEGECMICYDSKKKFYTIPCCCEQLICYSCFNTLIKTNHFKCMYCRKFIPFEKDIFFNTFQFIKENPKLRCYLIKKRIRKINSFLYKKKWKIQQNIILTYILEKMKENNYDLFEIKKLKFINTYTLKVTFFNGEIMHFTVSKHDNEL